MFAISAILNDVTFKYILFDGTIFQRFKIYSDLFIYKIKIHLFF